MTRRQRLRLVLPLLALSMVLGSGCRTLRPVVIHEGPLSDADLTMAWAKPRNQNASNFAEQLRIEAALEDGGHLSTKLLVTNISKYDGRAELLAKLELPDGTIYRVKLHKNRGEWTFGTGRFDVKVGDCTIVASVGKVTVHVVGDDFVLDYTIESELPALRPAGGLIDFGGAFYVTTVPVPRGKLTGTLVARAGAGEHGKGEPDESDADDGGPAKAEPPKVTRGDAEPADAAEGDAPDPGAGQESAGDAAGDEETVDFEGAAYVEHRATDLAPYRMASKWFKMSEFTTERTVIVSAFQRTAELGGDIQGWALIADDDGLAAYEDNLKVTPREVTLDPNTGYEVPGLVFLESKSGAGFRGVVKTTLPTERRDDLARMSTLERLVVRRVMKPWTYLFDNAEYLFKVQPAADAEEVPWRGQTRFEYQQLNPD